MTAKTNHPSFPQPKDPDTKIWRYMDFTKLIAMFENNGLFFARADMVGDPFEGSYARANEKLRPEMYAEDCKRLNIPIEKWLEGLKSFGGLNKWHRQWMVINCWHMNEFESAAMWTLYTKTNESICIQTTYNKLVSCLPESVYIGEVQYIDYNKIWLPEGNLFSPYMHKRKSFDHEHEIRAIRDEAPKCPLPMESGKIPPEYGVWITIDLHELIENIYIAPSSPNWFTELVEKTSQRYTFHFKVIKSSLAEEPFF